MHDATQTAKEENCEKLRKTLLEETKKIVKVANLPADKGGLNALRDIERIKENPGIRPEMFFCFPRFSQGVQLITEIVELPTLKEEPIYAAAGVQIKSNSEDANYVISDTVARVMALSDNNDERLMRSQSLFLKDLPEREVKTVEDLLFCSNQPHATTVKMATEKIAPMFGFTSSLTVKTLKSGTGLDPVAIGKWHSDFYGKRASKEKHDFDPLGIARLVDRFTYNTEILRIEILPNITFFTAGPVKDVLKGLSRGRPLRVLQSDRNDLVARATSRGFDEEGAVPKLKTYQKKKKNTTVIGAARGSARVKQKERSQMILSALLPLLDPKQELTQIKQASMIITI